MLIIYSTPMIDSATVWDSKTRFGVWPLAITKGEKLSTIYESDTYLKNNPSWHEEDSPWKANHIRKILQDNNVPTSRICEVGCGLGSILRNLEQYFPDSKLTGYDISPYAYEKAKERETQRTKFHFGDVTKAEQADFDVLLIVDVIEHVEDYMGFLKSLKTIGTYKVLHIPLDLSSQSVFRASPIMGLRRSVGHIHYFFKDSALATLTDCGYTVIDHRYTASRLELPNQTYSSQIMKWPRRFLYSLAPDMTVRMVGGYSLLVLVK